MTATNRLLKDAVTKGEFREDLYYRLNVLPLFIPPLRQRREDILPLALDMMQRFNKELKKNFIGFTPAAAELLQNYAWPGNIRELRNMVERTMILSSDVEISEDNLPEGCATLFLSHRTKRCWRSILHPPATRWSA